MRARSVLFALAVLAPAPTAWAAAKPLTEKVTERVVSTGVDEALEALNRPKNQERIGNLLSSPPMRQGMRELVAAIVRGVFDGVMSGAKEHHLDGLGDKLGKNVDDRVGGLTRVIVDAVMETALSRKNARRVESFGTQATRGVVAGLGQGIEKDLGPALARTLDRELGPVVARMIETQVMPAVARGLDSPEMQEAIATTTRTITASVVHGGEAALESEQAEAEAQGEESGLQLFGSRLALGYAIALFATFAFATLLVVLTVLLVRSNRRQRELTEIGRRREQVLMSLLDSVEAENPTLKTNLERLVKEQLHQHDSP